MILRTPPTKRQRDESRPTESPSTADGRIVVFEDTDPLSSNAHPSEQMLCTYQCRQMVKADFIDALDSAEKQVRDNQTKLESLNDNFCKADSERRKFRDRVLHVEQELAASRGREKALEEQLLKEINDSQERYKKHIESCNELETKIKQEKKLRESAEAAAILYEQKANALEENLNQHSKSTEKEIRQLHNEIAQSNRDSKLSISRLKADLERVECRYKNAEEESKLLKQQLEEVKKQYIECLHQKTEAENKILDLTSRDNTSSDSSILVKHLQDELRRYEAEVQEARKLRSSHENAELLKEKLSEEKRRRERAESELTKIPELELNLKKLEDELTSWKLLVKDIPDCSSPDDIPVKFAVLQKEIIQCTLKAGEANTLLKQREVSLDAAELGKQNAEIESALAKEKLQASLSEVKRIETMLSMVTEERDQLKSIVDDLKKRKDDEAGREFAREAGIQELESSVSNKERCIKELESLLLKQKIANSRQHDEIKVLNERLNSETRRIKSLERESDRLRSEISLLESKLGHGDYSAANTKVLRMVNTLSVDSEAKQTIEALQTELRKAKEKLEAFEELKRQSADAGKSVDSYVSGKLVQYKEQIATLEKREERYKTVFADRISVFRRACCELFGYKIVMDEHQRSNGIPVTRFTLQSIYAQSDDEKLEFEYESGNTTIVANDYTRQSEIAHQVDIFIRRLNSVPAFTANLTVESFNKRTLS
uniref:Mitotic spindle checkpoint protein MAD1 n=1 Tax=Kalanchoe fedtschenkoi TaxID=63787 RepID=A0A7N0ZWV9_KALFE